MSPSISHKSVFVSEKRLFPKFIALIVVISLTLGINFAVDGEYFHRRIHVYKSSYLGLFYFSLFWMISLWILKVRVENLSLWVVVIIASLFGGVAGSLAYFLGIWFNVFSVEKAMSISHSDAVMSAQILYLVLIFPFLALRSWIYGAVIGIFLFIGLKIVSRKPF